MSPLLRRPLGLAARRARRVARRLLRDSPNDAPLFALFPLGIGVANVRRMEARMPCLPRFVTDAEGGRGFVEGVDRILALRASA